MINVYICLFHRQITIKIEKYKEIQLHYFESDKNINNQSFFPLDGIGYMDQMMSVL